MHTQHTDPLDRGRADNLQAETRRRDGLRVEDATIMFLATWPVTNDAK